VLSAAQKQQLSDILRPASPPRELDHVYTYDQRERLLDVVRKHGPWKLILAQHFASAEELIATMTGSLPEGMTPTLEMFLTPTFRGYYAEHSACLYPEIDDCFFNSQFLEYARSYWNAKYAKPQRMLFNINGPCANLDPGHLDTPSFRGIRFENSPTWLCSVMGKSGLFRDYLIKMAQVITWFSNCPTSGFTYWPDGPLRTPRRVSPPIYNRGVLVQNEMMVHRGEANGSVDLQRPTGLTLDSVFSCDPGQPGRWLVRAGEQVIARYRTEDLRFLVHWSAEVFEDLAELKKNMDGTDDLTHERVFDMLIHDVRSRGIRIAAPSDPLRDQEFIRTLNAAYDIGGPTQYPPEAPISTFSPRAV